MKTTKLYMTLIYVLAFLALSVSSFAQDKDSKVSKTPEEKAKIRTERLKTSLNLTDDQYSRIYNLNLQRIKESQEFRENNAKMREERGKKNEEYRSSFKSILTDEQKTAMKNMHKEKKFKKGHRNRQHHKGHITR